MKRNMSDHTLGLDKFIKYNEMNSETMDKHWNKTQGEYPEMEEISTDPVLPERRKEERGPVQEMG